MASEEITAELIKSIGFIRRAGYTIAGIADDDDRNVYATAKAWAALLEDEIKKHGIDTLNLAVWNLCRRGVYGKVVVADLRKEIHDLTMESDPERMANLRCLAAVERRLEEEQERRLRNRTPEQIKEADEMWEAWQSGKTSLVDLWKQKMGAKNGSIRKDSNIREELW